MVRAYLDRPHLPLAFDTETTGLDPRTGKLVMLQFHQAGGCVAILDTRQQQEWLGEVIAPLFDGSLLVLGHNLKFDLNWIMEHLDIFPRRVFDTMLAEQVVRGLGREDAKKMGVDLTLKALARKYLEVEMSKEERNWFVDLDQREEWSQPFPPEQLDYAALDVSVLPSLYAAQLHLLGERDLFEVAKLEMRALPAITSIELSGVHIDVEGWRAFISEKEQEASQIEEEALRVYGSAILAARTKVYDEKLANYQQWERAKEAEEVLARECWEFQKPDEPWGKYKVRVMQEWRKDHPNPGKPKPDTSLPNLGSPVQLMAAFAEMGIEAKSTDSETLGMLEEDHPEIALLLKYRKAAKFVSSFGENLLKYVGSDGRIHPEYQQIGASTGRMSCTRPNWQQVPSKGDGKRLRKLVTAEEGNRLLTADFSNIELRILADITGDKNMLRLFADGADLHSYTARMMFGLDESVDVEHETLPGSDKTYRFVAKTINFGLVYGMSPMKLSRTLKVPKERAQELMDAYFRLYPGVARWMEQARREGLERLYSRTLAGRKRYYSLPEAPRPASRGTGDVQAWLEAKKEYNRARSRIERQSMNTPIQGTSADITKLALALLYEGGYLQNGLNLGRIVAVVHDEIVIETDLAYVDLMKAEHARAMGEAAAHYLRRVSLPPVKVVDDVCWSKE